MSDLLTNLKTQFRRTALDRRAAQTDKDALSAAIVQRLQQLPEYTQAATVLWYLDVRSEVRTRLALPQALASGQRMAIPYCEDNALRLFHLESLAELTTGAYGILEPASELRCRHERCVPPNEIDLAIVPGVAFDRAGTRLGHGAGYYDKLLAKLRPGVPRIALAFECQLFNELPREGHDMPMTAIITETDVYRCISP